MNRAWLIRADARLSNVETQVKALLPAVQVLLADVEAFRARLEALEAKPKVSRPPKAALLQES